MKGRASGLDIPLSFEPFLETIKHTFSGPEARVATKTYVPRHEAPKEVALSAHSCLVASQLGSAPKGAVASIARVGVQRTTRYRNRSTWNVDAVKEDGVNRLAPRAQMPLRAHNPLTRAHLRRREVRNKRASFDNLGNLQ